MKKWKSLIRAAAIAAFAGTLLLPVPLCAAQAGSAGIVLGDRAEEITQLPQSLEQVQDEEARDWERSVEPPVSWLTVEDHVLTIYDKHDSEVYRAVYPALHVTDDSAALAKALTEWNAEIGTGAWHSPVRAYSEEARAGGDDILLAYTDITPISAWGRVDEQMISFFMEGWFYAGGPHPSPTSRLTPSTGERVGRSVSMRSSRAERCCSRQSRRRSARSTPPPWSATSTAASGRRCSCSIRRRRGWTASAGTWRRMAASRSTTRTPSSPPTRRATSASRSRARTHRASSRTPIR